MIIEEGVEGENQAHVVIQGHTLQLFYSWNDHEPFTYYEHTTRNALNHTRVTQHEVTSWSRARDMSYHQCIQRCEIHSKTVCRLCFEEKYDKAWMLCKECNALVGHLRCFKNYHNTSSNGIRCPNCQLQMFLPIVDGLVSGQDPKLFVPCQLEPCRVRIHSSAQNVEAPEM